MKTHIRRFKLSDTFIDQYKDHYVPKHLANYRTLYARCIMFFVFISKKFAIQTFFSFVLQCFVIDHL